MDSRATCEAVPLEHRPVCPRRLAPWKQSASLLAQLKVVQGRPVLAFKEQIFLN